MISFLDDFDIVPTPKSKPDLPMPISAHDVDRNEPMDMDLPLADPCGYCGAFRMTVGWYVCTGMCSVCSDEAMRDDSTT